MPRGIIVPKSNQLGNEVLGPQRLPLLDAEQIGGEETARATSRLGRTVGEIGLDLKAKEDETVASDGLSTFEPLWQSDLSALKKRRRGKGVLAGEDSDEDLITEGLRLRKDRRDQAIETMKNRAQREALTQAIDSRDRFAVNSLRNHFDRESDTYERETDINSAIMGAQIIAGGESEDEIEEGIGGIETIIQKMRARDDWSPSTVAVERIKFTSPSIVKSLQTQAIVDPDGAERRMRGYLGREKQILDKLQVKGLLETFEREGLAARAQGIAAEALALIVPGEGIEKSIARVRSMSSGNTEKEAVRILASTLSLRAADEENRLDGIERQMASDVVNLFAELPDLRNQPLELEAMRVAVRRKAEDEGLGREEIKSILDLYDAESKGRPKKTNWKKYEEISRDPAQLLDWSSLDIELAFVGSQLTEAFELKGQMERGELLETELVSKEISAQLDLLRWTPKDHGHKMGQLRALMVGDIIEEQKKGVPTRERRMEIYTNRVAEIFDARGRDQGQTVRSNESTIERAVSRDQNVLALAVLHASSGGKQVATDAAIVSRYFNLIRDIDNAGGIQASEDLRGIYEANGRDARRKLNAAGYVDTDLYNFQALVDQELREKEDEARRVRRAARSAKKREEQASRPPRRSGRGEAFDRGQREALQRARDQ